MDKLMGEIPGKNNYAGNLRDEGFESMALNLDGTPKDVSRYHRFVKILFPENLDVSRGEAEGTLGSRGPVILQGPLEPRVCAHKMV